MKCMIVLHFYFAFVVSFFNDKVTWRLYNTETGYFCIVIMFSLYEDLIV